MNLSDINWIEVFTILVPICAFLKWFITRMDKKFESIDKRFDTMFSELKEIRKDIQNLDSRVSRIEGQLSPRFWETKIEREYRVEIPVTSQESKK
jgi:hypothetical protein